MYFLKEKNRKTCLTIIMYDFNKKILNIMFNSKPYVLYFKLKEKNVDDDIT